MCKQICSYKHAYVAALAAVAVAVQLNMTSEQQRAEYAFADNLISNSKVKPFNKILVAKLHTKVQTLTSLKCTATLSF